MTSKNSYRIYYTVPYVLEVEAESKENALDIANETDISEWLHDTSDGDYEIELINTQSGE